MFSLIIPVYKNTENIPSLLAAVETLAKTCKERFSQSLEVVFVVDGFMDPCYGILKKQLPQTAFASQLVTHSRNFGSFPAIRTGLSVARGKYFAVMAADLQEPPELILQFFDTLVAGHHDIVVGSRVSRGDTFMTRMSSGIFWRMYRSLVMKDMPVNGVDIFACNQPFLICLLKLEESHSSLVGLIYWLGFRRAEVPYSRRPREYGRSAWSMRKKIKYMFDSLFSFTDIPIRFLISIGALGVFLSVGLSIMILLGKIFGQIAVPGYATTALLVTFFGGINTFGIGIIGNYIWRTYENTKKRPLSVTLTHDVFNSRKES